MTWNKVGNIFSPEISNENPFLLSHASNPVAMKTQDPNVVKIFYSARDQDNRSSISSFDFSLTEMEVVSVVGKPLAKWTDGLPFGRDGLSPGCLSFMNGKPELWVMGWQRPPDSHWYGEIGSLKLDQVGGIRSVPSDPIFGLSQSNPLGLSYPWIHNFGGYYRMYFGSTVHWGDGKGEMLHVIKSARSVDGLNWTQESQIIPEDHTQMAFSRPTVYENPDGYLEMWYSVRGSDSRSHYRIDYARSEDGLSWQPFPFSKFSVLPGSAEWESEMTEYPCLFEFQGHKFMFYNGNGYGKTGIGLAFWD